MKTADASKVWRETSAAPSMVETAAAPGTEPVATFPAWDTLELAACLASHAAISLRSIGTPHIGRHHQTYERLAEAEQLLRSALATVQRHKTKLAGGL